MARFSVAVPLFALAGLSACATYDTDYPGAPVASASTTGAIVTVPSAVVTTPGTIAVVPGAAVTAPPVVVTAPPVVASFHTGFGVVESISPINVVPPAQPSASAGSSTVAPFNAYRLTVRMDDGTVQTIDQDNRSFVVGDRIQITSDGRVIRR